MAAYAGVVSLMNTMEQIMNHPRLSTSFDRTQMEFLQEKAAFLLDFLEREDSHGGMSKEELEGLGSQIASAVHKAEDAIEFHIAQQIQICSNLPYNMQKVLKSVDSIKEKVVVKWGFKEEQPTYSTTMTSSRAVDTGKSSTVEFEDDIWTRLMEKLAGHSSSRQVILIVGMGGIGKTTLARNAYESSLIVQFFDIRAWATISQHCNECQVLSELLSCLKKSTSGTVDELGERLHKELYGRRYLITLDDVWSVEVWERIGLYFPQNGNGSRIVMTTRLSNLSISSGSYSFEMKFLDDDKSWKLLREKTFGQEDCPPHLVEIGKKIARQCKGLPLSIVVIGGLLRKSNKTKEYWEKVAEDISSILRSGEGEHCMNVLSLSYSQLPARLKPCFLYMGVFEEDQEVRASQLIKLWVGEGFLKPNGIESLEEVAECCLKDLIERNLILVRRSGLNQKVKTCSIHDLLRELCLRVAKKENFFQDMSTPNIPQGILIECRRFIFQRGRPLSAVFAKLGPQSLARSLISDGRSLPLSLPLLRVSSEVPLECNPMPVNMRYLSCKLSGNSNFVLPKSLSLLWNLQTLTIKGDPKFLIAAPSEIWEMKQLRHLQSNTAIIVPDPRPNDNEDDFNLQNLQTLVTALKFRLSDDVCKRIPNIKKLHLRYYYFSTLYCLSNLGRLQKLQSLNFHLSGTPRRDDLVHHLTFPSSLRKLSLRGCGLYWEDLTEIGSSLPNLEVLKLEPNSVVGTQWDPIEGAFPRLKLLKIYELDLVYWAADNSHFPVLEELFLRSMRSLDEIPLAMAEIPTLECIHLENCSSSSSISSAKILEEQMSSGNEEFRVRISFWNPNDTDRFWEEADIKIFAHKNFELMDDGRSVAPLHSEAEAMRLLTKWMNDIRI